MPKHSGTDSQDHENAHGHAHSGAHMAALDSDDPKVLEATIEEEKRQLHRTIDELRDVIHDATDWRSRVRAQPYKAMGLALAVGAVAGVITRRNASTNSVPSLQYEYHYEEDDDGEEFDETRDRLPRRRIRAIRSAIKPSALSGMMGMLLGVVTRRMADVAEERVRSHFSTKPPRDGEE